MEDRATEVAEVCDWMPTVLDGETCGTPEYRLPACVARVLDDLSVDTTQMLAEEGVEDPWVIVEEARWGSRLGTILSAAWALGALPWGDVADLEPGPDVPPAALATLLDVVTATGNPDLGAAVYNLAAARVRRVRAGEDEGAHAGLRVLDRTLFVYDGSLRGVAAAGMLAHEARHADGPRHVDCPWGEAAACDLDDSGSWALQLVLLGVGSRAAPSAAEACIAPYRRQAERHLLGSAG